MKHVLESQGLESRLRHALDRDGIDLGRLAAIVRATGAADIESVVRRKPTGVFARRLWFLYEWLTGRKLDVPEPAGRLRFVPVLDPARQAALKVGVPSGRHRVIDNLPGTPRFCPMVRWTRALRAASAKPWDVQAGRMFASAGQDSPSAPSRQRREAESSFALAGERPTDARIVRWADAIGQAGARMLTLNELLRLQRVVCGGVSSTRLGLRSGVPAPAAVEGRAVSCGARVEDLDELVGGLIDFAERAIGGGVDPVIAAAAVAFGFCHIRPFACGNGHLHRWLVHHTFDVAGCTPPGFTIPIGTAMVRRLAEYREVATCAPHETADAYRFADMTRHAEFLYACLEDCVERDADDCALAVDAGA